MKIKPEPFSHKMLDVNRVIRRMREVIVRVNMGINCEAD